MSAQTAPVEVAPQTVSGSSSSMEHAAPPTGTKKSSNQGRNRGSSSKVSSRGHQSSHIPSADEVMQASTSRKKPPVNQKDRETKSRPSNRSHVGHKEGSKFGGGASREHSSRAKGSDGHHSSSRHRGGNNNSLDSSSNTSSSSSSNSSSKADSRIWSSNRFEKLEVDPDNENFSTSLESSASGENVSRSSPSTSYTSLSGSIGASTSASSTLSGSSSGKSSGEERRPAKERGGRGGKGTRGRGMSKFQESGEAGGRSVGHSTKDERTARDGGKEEGVQRKRSPKQIKFDLPDGKDQGAKENGTSADSAKSDATPPSSLSETKTVPDMTADGPTESMAQITHDTKSHRIIYDREFLLAFRSSSVSPPPELVLSELLVLHHRPSAEPPQRKESPECVDENRMYKHPTALTLIKEHDKHFVGRVSLSPQRRSFQRGCSWKDRVSNSEGSDSSLKTPPPNQDEPQFKFEEPKAAQRRPSGPRVINHIPLRDQEQAAAGGGRVSRKDWREGQSGWKHSSRDHDQYMEPEPEWMEFGPTDRFDVIELKGFDDQDAEEGHPDSKDVEGSLEKEDLPKSSPDDGGNPDRQQTDEHANPPATPSKQEEENEFILDGFDFSTGLSICQALDEDEDEPDNLKTTGGGGDLLSSKVKNPAELSNALLKALKVGKEESAQPKKQPATSTNTGIIADSSRMPPVNALTLEEIHARENISVRPPPGGNQVLVEKPSNSGEGMQAFNKLLAVLESKKNKPLAEEHPHSPQKFNSGQQMPHQNVGISRPDKPMMKQPVTPSYGFALEKELLDMEDDFSPRSASPIPYSEPHLRRLEQLERMLETMDRMDPTVSQPPPPHHHHQGYFPPAHPAPPPHHLLHQMDHPHAPMEREGRGWMYPERGRPAPPPQQARQQQPMLPPGGPRTAAKNWAVEMEQRRIQELHQMQMAKEKEVEAYGGRGGFGKGPSSSSKPNISLLPTAVMRHIHTSKPSQTTADLPKTTSISTRLDQDLTSKASQSHSVLNSLLNQSPELTGHAPNGDFPLQQPPLPPHARQQMMHHHPHHHHHSAASGMRMAPPTGHAPPKPADHPPSGPPLYPPYSVPMAHGMPLRNPYMY